MRCPIALVLLSISPPLTAAADVALAGGLGFAGSEKARAEAVSAVGVSIGAPFASRHRFQFDYLFVEPGQFLTAGYVVQGLETRNAGLAVLFAAGATVVDIGKSLFVRPQLRLYGHVGPTLTVLPAVAVGWRF